MFQTLDTVCPSGARIGVTVALLLSQLPSSPLPPASRDCVVKLVHQAALELSWGMDAEVVGAPDFGDGLHQLGVEVQAHTWERE